MSATVNESRELLETRNLHGFLKLFAAESILLMAQDGAGYCTQKILPAILREMFTANRVAAESVVLLWRLIRSGQLLVVENDILQAINERIDSSIAELDGPGALPAAKLRTYAPELLEQEPSGPIRVASKPPSLAISMKRIVIGSSYKMGFMDMSDAFNFKKNLCASSQELEFLKAVRQFFPNLHAYPNLPLRNFINLESMGALADDSMRRFCWGSQVDVLLCTEDEDPVAGIELDSAHHDKTEAQDRDELKNKLFKLAGVPLVRIRPVDTSNARAEDFYDLLMAEAEALDALRPRRLRPRRNHDMLVPADVQVRKYQGATTS